MRRSNGGNLSKFVKKHKPVIQEAGWFPNRINSEISILRCIIIKLLKSKGKENSQEQADKNDTLPGGKNNLNYGVFLIRKYKGQKKVAQYFQVLSIQSPIASKNILQKWRKNEDILWWRKSIRICHQQNYPKRTKGNSLNRKGIIRWGT